MPQGATPLNIYQYNQDAGATGGQAAAGGLTGLAGAIIGNPQQLAQARYLGAGTAQETAQAAAQQLDNQSVQQFQGLAADPTNYTPQGIAKMMALAAGSPTLSARAAELVNASMAAQAAPGTGTGAPGSPTVQQASNFGALSGVTSYGNTPTGFTADLGNRVQVANIGAGAEVASANIGAKAAEADTAATIQGENQRTLAQVVVNGKPIDMPAVQAGATGAQYYDPAVANTNAAANAASVPVVGPGGAPRLMTTQQAIATGATPEPASSDAAAAGVFEGNVNPPSAAASVSGVPAGGLGAVMTGAIQPPSQTTGIAPVQQAALAPPPAGAQAAPQTPTGAAPVEPQAAGGPAPAPAPAPTPDQGLPPDERQQLINAVMSKFTGQAVPGSTDAAQAQQVDNLITQRLQAQSPGMMGRYAPSQDLMNPIRMQVAYLYAHDPNVRGNMQQAITQAIMNVTGAKGQNVNRDYHMFAPGTPPQLMLNDPSQIVWPQGMQVPQQYQSQGQAPGSASPMVGQGQPSGLASTIVPQANPVAPQQGQSAAAPTSLASTIAPSALAAPASASAPAPQQSGLSPQAQLMAEAQQRINAWNASGQPPAVIQQNIAAIVQRLRQLGALPSLPPGTPH